MISTIFETSNISMGYCYSSSARSCSDLLTPTHLLFSSRLWLVLGVFLVATSLRMYATCQQLAQAQALAAVNNGLLGHTELSLHMPPSIALATRGRLQGLRLQLALLDREFDDLDYDAWRALDSDNVPNANSMSEEEINALPVHKYKAAGPQSCSWKFMDLYAGILSSAGSSMQHASSSASSEKKQENANVVGGVKALEDELTCSVCLGKLMWENLFVACHARIRFVSEIIILAPYPSICFEVAFWSRINFWNNLIIFCGSVITFT